ncbi:ATP synthase lipid-binding protein, putative [Eimeria necatrix]|uniref:ATP synthase lipid-binding protein, putative n=1 Tax=Eimeria necatrix TaxID=51315 RepID=U6MXU7_9EIME|nr:ATP synthase lipid-binding protein, putative [Eimeria necatrix]CDJ68791.1 ATP synthase lipid-binding protein, putative [Eimeria necatrix]
MAFFAPARLALAPGGACSRAAAAALAAPKPAPLLPFCGSFCGSFCPTLAFRALSTAPLLQRHRAVAQEPCARWPAAALTPLSSSSSSSSSSGPSPVSCPSQAL